MTDFPYPAIGLIEIESIARGIVCVDAVLKRASVRLHVTEAITPGKYLLLFSGGVAEVEESLKAGLSIADEKLVDQLYLPQAHPAIADGITDRLAPVTIGALGIVETATVASTLLAADAACKTAKVTLCSMRLAKGIGGKGYFTFTGELADVEASLSAAAAMVREGLLVAAELVSSADAGMDGSVL